MKKSLPVVLGLLAGLFALFEYYVPLAELDPPMKFLNEMTQVLASAAFLLGAINVLQVNVPIIRRRKEDWPYKLVLVGGALVMGLAGVAWHEFGGAAADAGIGRERTGRTELVVVAPLAEVSVDGAAPVSIAGGRLVLPVSAGEHAVVVRHAAAGYGELAAPVRVAEGETTTVTPVLPMLWGPSGRVFTWLFNHVFDPCNSTMFALLAFFIASAAFRAFRARNVEAALLLGAAILVMMGRVPIGRAISDVFPAVADWIVDYANNAGRRAIMMGAALGAVATGLRVILGLERSHLGKD